MSYLVAPLLLACGLAAAAPGETPPPLAVEPSPPALFAVEITTGPAWDAAKKPHEQAHFGEHSAHLKRLREQGALVLGARYSDKGLLVLQASSEEEARALMQQDPSMQNGVFKFALFPFNVFYPGTVEGRARRAGS